MPITDFWQKKNAKDGLYPVCRKCSRPAGKRKYAEHRLEKIAYGKKYRDEHPRMGQIYAAKTRQRVLQRIAKAHGNLMVYCIRCGFTDTRALQIDHINGGGRKEIDSMRTWQYYKQILVAPLEEVRKNYQVLCANCNFIKKEENQENYKWRVEKKNE